MAPGLAKISAAKGIETVANSNAITILYTQSFSIQMHPELAFPHQEVSTPGGLDPPTYLPS